jgi:hypothetical protein
MLSYDIYCSYHVNLQKRFTKFFKSALPTIQKIRGAIPSMHVKNHVELCQYLWAFKYIPYSGETAAELIEGSWGENNAAAGSTKEQNEGHRHDSLDDFFGHWNFKKIRQIGASLSS